MDGVYQECDRDASKFMTDGKLETGFWHSENRTNGFAVFPLAEPYYIKTIKMWDRTNPRLLDRKVGAKVYIHEDENVS